MPLRLSRRTHRVAGISILVVALVLAATWAYGDHSSTTLPATDSAPVSMGGERPREARRDLPVVHAPSEETAEPRRAAIPWTTLLLVGGDGRPLPGGAALRIADPDARTTRALKRYPADDDGHIVLTGTAIGREEELFPDLLLLAHGHVSALATDVAERVGNGEWRASLLRAAGVRLVLRDTLGEGVRNVPVAVSSSTLSSAALDNTDVAEGWHPGVRPDAIHCGVTDQYGKVEFGRLLGGHDYEVFVLGSDFVFISTTVEDMAVTRFRGVEGVDSELHLSVAPVLCSAVIPSAKREVGLIAEKHDDLLQESAGLGRTMRARMMLHRQFPDAAIFLALGKRGARSEGEDARTFVARVDGESRWRGKLDLLPPTKLQEPPRITIDAGTPSPSSALRVELVDRGGQPMDGVRYRLRAASRDRRALRIPVVVSGQDVPLPPGKYHLRAARRAMSGLPDGQSRLIDVRQGATEVVKLRLDTEWRRVELAIQFPDGTHPSYAVLSFEAHGFADGLRSMRPSQVPAWLPVGRCKITVRVHGYATTTKEIEVVPSVKQEHAPMQVAVVVDQAASKGRE